MVSEDGCHWPRTSAVGVSAIASERGARSATRRGFSTAFWFLGCRKSSRLRVGLCVRMRSWAVVLRVDDSMARLSTASTSEWMVQRAEDPAEAGRERIEAASDLG